MPFATAGTDPPTGGAAQMLLRVTDPTARTWYLPLLLRRLVLGREENVDVPLESTKVSRQHAELVCDPFRRWWVRDLGSRNGTRVNGARITESILQPGDILEVGDFVLSLCPAAPPSRVMARATATGSQTLLEPGPLHGAQGESPGLGRIRALRELEPPKIGAAHLSAVTEFAHRLNTTQDAGARLRALCELMVGREFHGRSVLVLHVRRDDPQRPQVVWGPALGPALAAEVATGAAGTSVMPPLSRGVLRAVCQSPEPVMATNVSAAQGRLELSISPDQMAMTVIAVPLRSDDREVELLYMVLGPECGHGDWLALAALAAKHYQQAEALWANVEKIRQYAAVERELQKAQEIQLRLVPRATAVPGLGLAIGFRPCYWVGGDYVDVLPMSDGRTLLAVADVCGKGLSAALVASSVHTLVHANIRAGKDLSAATRELNAYLLEDLGGESFVTMLAVALDPVSGTYECVNCGHPPALVVGQGGTVRKLESAGNPPLGVDAAAMETRHGSLATGELLALFTDGVSELTDPSQQMLGVDGLIERLCPLCSGDPPPSVQEISARLTAALDEYQAGQLAPDDRTFLLVRREA